MMPKANRRAFLRGTGVSLVVPPFLSLTRSLNAASSFSSAALPATTATGAPLRMAFMSIPNGVQQDHWFPTNGEDGIVLSPTLEPLAKVKSKIQVIGGLDHIHATAGNDGAGDHARANATFLTGARARKTAGKDIHVGISVDQVAAQRVGGATRFQSLELSSDAVRNSGSCDSGYACAYQYNLSWSSPTTPVTPEPNPRLVFERLFGAGEHGQRQKNFELRQQSNRSVLDFVLEDAKELSRALSNEDRIKLEEYVSSVRQIEERIKSAERFGLVPDPNLPTPDGVPIDFGNHIDLNLDLMLLAFQTDSTRIASLLIAYDGSNRTFPDLGIIEGHHYLTHNQRVPELAKKVALIDRFYMQRFANFLEKMDQVRDVDGNTMLHNSMIVYGGAIADGNRHTHANLPVVLAGAGGGTLKTGRFIDAREKPMSNLFVEMLNRFGVETTAFGDSNGSLSEIG
jgi:hypothetical protein